MVSYIASPDTIEVFIKKCSAENIGKVLLPSIADNDVDLEGFLATTSGFGFISDSNSSPSAILLYVNDEIISNEEVSFRVAP